MGLLQGWVGPTLQDITCISSDKFYNILCYMYKFRKFHQSHKEETLAELEKGKLDVVITTFETCRDNLVGLLC